MATPSTRWQIAGVTIPLGPLAVRVAVNRRGALAVAIGLRRWLNR